MKPFTYAGRRKVVDCIQDIERGALLQSYSIKEVKVSFHWESHTNETKPCSSVAVASHPQKAREERAERLHQKEEGRGLGSMPREQPEPRVSSSGSSRMGSLELVVIDDAFGAYADLYSDVLRVSVAATPEQIQLAYFDRRSELFTLLAKLDSRQQDESTLMQRMEAERKMDSVVLAVRILGDPDQRLQYDRIRQERLRNRRRSKNGQLPNPAEEEEEVQVQSQAKLHTQSTPVKAGGKPPRGDGHKTHKHKKRGTSRGDEPYVNTHNTEEAPQPAVVTPTKSESELDITDDEEDTRVDPRDMSMDSYEMRQEDGDATLYTMTSFDQPDHHHKHSGYLSFITNSRIVRKISDEISGACEDTLVSVDQVFNAFTLTDKDIRAVTKRIDKAKKQLDN